MQYLKDGVHAATIDRALVVLDLNADAYLCLPTGGERVLPRSDGGAAIQFGLAYAALEKAGLLQTLEPPTGRALPPKPTQTCIHTLETIRWRDVRSGVAAALEMRRVRPAAGITAYLGERPMSRVGDTAVMRAARAFWRLQPWLPIEGECLVRSATLVRALRNQGMAADWVFGVRLFPFMAHCWVQSGDTCLNDDVERLAPYKPLLCR